MIEYLALLAALIVLPVWPVQAEPPHNPGSVGSDVPATYAAVPHRFIQLDSIVRFYARGHGYSVNFTYEWRPSDSARPRPVQLS